MIFRVYRLPGSQKVWHVDTGQDTTVVNIFGFTCDDLPVKTVDIGGQNIPRAWVEIEGNLFVSKQGWGRFMRETATLLPCREVSLSSCFDSGHTAEEKKSLLEVIKKSHCTLRVMDAAEKLSRQMTDEEIEKLEKSSDKQIRITEAIDGV